MFFKDYLHNAFYTTKYHLIKYAFIYVPILGLLIYLLLKRFVNLTFHIEFISNIINVSGILAGFLFTSLGIIIALPINKFTQELRNRGYMKIIYRALIIGIVTLLISMLLGLFNINMSVVVIFFIIGISETFLSAYYLYRVSYFSSKSI